ncbi:NusG domain II-containing protein [Paenibacillus antri]|uniref:NusG domain II-containing protein n=1 Tax=Paenibacillus antri TaxID=2582848 RepID=A0A5R9GF19_9BACL|nr:NusG domain II-containing protein [Paenibacillus antri]TLS49995.1 NusG domain II-containing protein [Paenibacillus antri]
MKKGDLWILFSMLLMVTSVYILKWLHQSPEEALQKPTIARIELDGKLYRDVELSGVSEMIEIRTSKGYDLLKVDNGGIEVAESDCPEKICMSYGKIDRVGEVIICLPNRMFIKIVDGGQPEIDALSA